MKDTYFFSHDYNSRTDSKIKKLLSKHGFLGYGLFWAIIEGLYNNANAMPTDYDSIAFDLRSDSVLIKSIVEDFDLFLIDGDFFGSESVKRRLGVRNEKSIKASESANKRWKNANALPTDSERNANAMPTQCESNYVVCKGKDTIGQEIIKNEKTGYDITENDRTGQKSEIKRAIIIDEDADLPF